MRSLKPVAPSEHEAIIAQFPPNPYLERLVEKALALGITFESSPVPEQWLYHPGRRAILVWEPDLKEQSLSYLVVVLAHEIGHAVDFDENPDHLVAAKELHWLDVPWEVEAAAFIHGFRLLKELWVPISLDDYQMMIEEPVATMVRQAIEEEHLCCLLSRSCQERSPDSRAVS